MSGAVIQQFVDTIVGNWIAVSRDIRGHHLVGFGQPVKPADTSRGAYSKAEAWLDMTMSAAWKDGAAVINKGRKMRLAAGQLMAGYAWLAKRWNWTVKTVRTFLAKLMGEEEAMVAGCNRSEDGPEKGKQLGNQVQVLTICNYKKYQSAIAVDEAIEGQATGKQGASEGHESNTVTREQEEEVIPNGMTGSAAAPTDVPPKKIRAKKEKGAKLTADWELPADWRAETKEKFSVNDFQINRMAARFKEYWLSADAKGGGLKLDWKRTWTNGLNIHLDRYGNFGPSAAGEPRYAGQGPSGLSKAEQRKKLYQGCEI